MRTINSIITKLLLGVGLVVGLSLVSGCATDTSTASGTTWMPPMKGYEHTVMLNPINTQARAEELKPDDSTVMVCARCRSVTVEHVDLDRGHIRMVTPYQKHLCPGCEGTIEVVGHGQQDKHYAVTHSCSKCGSESAFCCATKPGAGSTEGMERK